jgi:hypothetical protein
MHWLKSKGCGGTPVYDLIEEPFIRAVVQRDGDWWVWIPGERRRLPGEFRTMREAKEVAEGYWKKSGSKAAKRPGASAAPRRLTEPKARSISRER